MLKNIWKALTHPMLKRQRIALVKYHVKTGAKVQVYRIRSWVQR